MTPIKAAAEPSRDALKPCPFCGSKVALCILEDEPGEIISAWVNCSCGVETHERRTEDEAIARWNTRAPAGNAGVVNPDGFNGCMRVAAEAFDFLADHERPVYGQQKYNAEHLFQLASELRKTSAAIAALPQPAWRCFHCDETFTDAEAAKEHFGYDMLAEPGCKLNAIEGGLLGIVRRQEERLDAYHREDTASYREFYSLGADHSRAMRREEEKGYARGLADGQAPASRSPIPEAPVVREDLLTDINKAAHSAGTNAWVRDVLKRAYRALKPQDGGESGS